METKLTDIGSERAVLAGLLQHGVDAYVAISDVVSQDTFGHFNNQVLFKCIEKVILVWSL